MFHGGVIRAKKSWAQTETAGERRSISGESVDQCYEIWRPFKLSNKNVNTAVLV